MADTSARALTSATLGAWLLKANPKTYPIADWIRDRPDEPIRVWSVQQNYRSAMMEAGQTVYLWVSGDGREIESGVWGVGRITGPCEPGVADGDWLDGVAAARATYFAAVDIDFLASPVTRADLLTDSRFADLEVLRAPTGANPSFLTPDQAAAMHQLAQAADRGTCPRCQSGEVMHVVFGMLPFGALDDAPPWVVEGGCVISGLMTNRHCSACGLDWLATRGGKAHVRTLRELRNLLGLTSNEELENWLWNYSDVDVHLEDVPLDDEELGMLTLRISTRGVGLEFPFPLSELTSTVDELLDDLFGDEEDDLHE